MLAYPVTANLWSLGLHVQFGWDARAQLLDPFLVALALG